MEQLIHLKETHSTNTYLRDYLRKERLPEGSVVWADFQTAGRGQIGHTWESEAGTNLTFSVVLYPTCLPANRQFLISQIASLSVKQTLDAYTEGITVKWPNDVYWHDRKICGMLIEHEVMGTSLDTSILGIGLNVNQTEFRSDAPNPVSLYQITGKKQPLDALLDEFIRHLYANYLLLLQEREAEITSLYRQSLYRGQGFYPYEDDKGRFEAEIADIEPTGHLLLRLRNGEVRRYAFKEVRYDLNGQYL